MSYLDEYMKCLNNPSIEVIHYAVGLDINLTLPHIPYFAILTRLIKKDPEKMIKMFYEYDQYKNIHFPSLTYIKNRKFKSKLVGFYSSMRRIINYTPTHYDRTLLLHISKSKYTVFYIWRRIKKWYPICLPHSLDIIPRWIQLCIMNNFPIFIPLTNKIDMFINNN